MAKAIRENRPISKSIVPDGLQGRDYVRELVRIRDGRTCRRCKKKWKKGMRRFDVHHLNGLCGKKSRKHDRVEDIGGLITLCHKCHFNHPSHSRMSYQHQPH